MKAVSGLPEAVESLCAVRTARLRSEDDYRITHPRHALLGFGDTQTLQDAAEISQASLGPSHVPVDGCLDGQIGTHHGEIWDHRSRQRRSDVPDFDSFIPNICQAAACRGEIDLLRRASTGGQGEPGKAACRCGCEYAPNPPVSQVHGMEGIRDADITPPEPRTGNNP